MRKRINFSSHPVPVLYRYYGMLQSVNVSSPPAAFVSVSWHPACPIQLVRQLRLSPPRAFVLRRESRAVRLARSSKRARAFLTAGIHVRLLEISPLKGRGSRTFSISLAFLENRGRPWPPSDESCFWEHGEISIFNIEITAKSWSLRCFCKTSHSVKFVLFFT